MYKLKATKTSDGLYALVAYNDEFQDFYEIPETHARAFVKIICQALDGNLDPQEATWVNNSYGIEQPANTSGVYAVSIRIGQLSVRSYILNKRKLAEFKSSLLSALNG